MNKKQKGLVIGVIVVAVLVILTIALVLVKNKIKSIKCISTWEEEALSYFADTGTIETSLWALVENGYIEKVKDKCLIIALENNKIVSKKSDCEQAEAYSKMPIVKLTATNDFKIDEWNKSGARISFNLKNNGNSFYKKEDITKVIWFDGDANEEKESIDIPNKNLEKTYTLYLEFNDGEYELEKQFDVKIDMDAPKLKDYFFKDRLVFANYEDISGAKVYYKLTKNDVKPEKSEMQEEIRDIECNVDYYVWSYAVDAALNESDITLLGRHNISCEFITSGSGSNQK